MKVWMDLDLYKKISLYNFIGFTLFNVFKNYLRTIENVIIQCNIDVRNHISSKVNALTFTSTKK